MTLDKLKKQAEACDRGEDWFVAEGLAERLRACDFSCTPEADAAFIAAVSPATVLKLLEMIAVLKKGHEDMYWRSYSQQVLRCAAELERSL